MKLSVDNSQRLTTGISFILEFYKVLMGTCLLLFVPQDCNGTVCSLHDNLTNDDTLHIAAKSFNLITFLSIMYYYYIELRRENWSITYLDIDHNKTHNNLDNEIESYPDFKLALHMINKKFLKAIRLSSILVVINFAISFAAIQQISLTQSGINAFISFILLIGMKMKHSHFIASKSVKKERVYSAYMKLPQIYNTIDQDFTNNKNKDTIIEIPDENNEQTQTTEQTEQTEQTEEVVDYNEVSIQEKKEN